MIVVSDTTPIISLMKAGRLELLHKLFGTVYIPEAVYQELTENKSGGGNQRWLNARKHQISPP